MLEGLGAIEVKLSTTFDNKDFRTDGDFWVKEPKQNPKLKYAKIGNCLISAQYGVSIEMNEENKGYPIYRMNEIHNMLCDIEVSKSAELTRSEFEVFKLNDRDILFNRTNSYEWVGRTGLYKKTNEKDFVFASYLVRFVTNQKIILPEYLTTFLNSKHGIWDIKRRARQSVNQTNVNPEEVKQIYIPILDIKIQGLIKKYFDTAVLNLQKSSSLYAEAENILLHELGLSDWKPTIKNNNTKTLNESFLSSGRIDAEYYQPKFDELLDIIKNYKYGYTKLSYLINEYSTGFPFDSDRFVFDGFPLIRISNIKKGKLDLSDAITIPLEDVELSKKDIVKPNDLLLSMSGTIGNCCKVPDGINAIINQRILRFSAKNFDADVLCLLINSVICELQLQRVGTGGVQTNISGTDIFNMLIPKINRETQKIISIKIQESFVLQTQSMQLLEAVKKAVEIAIEHDEKAALIYLSKM